MIYVLATIEVAAGQREELLAEFHRIVPLVRAEAGCLEYGPAIDLASGLTAQIPLRSDVVTVVEKWASLDALRAHTTAPHMQEYRRRVKDMILRVELQILQPAQQLTNAEKEKYDPPHCNSRLPTTDCR
jgi:quinol monooxygenase YgiN